MSRKRVVAGSLVIAAVLVLFGIYSYANLRSLNNEGSEVVNDTNPGNSVAKQAKRSDIDVGNTVQFSYGKTEDGQDILREYTVTSVRQIVMQDKNVKHTVFEGCSSRKDDGPSCDVYVLNTKGKPVFLTNSYHSGESVGSYADFLKERKEKDVANIASISSYGEDVGVLVRLDRYPFMYQHVQCADKSGIGGAVTGCGLYGVDVDTLSDSITSQTHFYSGLTNSWSAPDAEFGDDPDGKEVNTITAGKTVNDDYITFELKSETEHAQTSKEKTVSAVLSVYMTGANQGQYKEGKTLLTTTVSTSTKINLTYDYKTQADIAEITIGERAYLFDFSTRTLNEKKLP